MRVLAGTVELCDNDGMTERRERCTPSLEPSRGCDGLRLALLCDRASSQVDSGGVMDRVPLHRPTYRKHPENN